jgi:hypothetical protein
MAEQSNIKHEVSTMSHSTTKLPLAIATIVTLGVLALAPTGASAMGFGGHMMMHGGGGGGGHGFGGGGHFVMLHGGAGGVHPPHPGPHPNPGPHPGPHPHPHWHPHWGWGVGYYGGATAVYSTPTYSTPTYTVRTNTCTCLTKEYLPDNSVLFKDVCTKESALAPVNNDQTNVPGPQGYQAGPPQTQTR